MGVPLWFFVWTLHSLGAVGAVSSVDIKCHEQEQLHEKPTDPYYFFKVSFGGAGRSVQNRVTFIVFELRSTSQNVELSSRSQCETH